MMQDFGFGACGQVLSSLRPRDAVGLPPWACLENAGPGPDRFIELDQAAARTWRFCLVIITAQETHATLLAKAAATGGPSGYDAGKKIKHPCFAARVL